MCIRDSRWIVDKPAWDEQVLVKEAWDELIKEAWDEQVLVKEAWDETVHHEEEGHYEKGDLISPEEDVYKRQPVSSSKALRSVPGES